MLAQYEESCRSAASRASIERNDPAGTTILRERRPCLSSRPRVMFGSVSVQSAEQIEEGADLVGSVELGAEKMRGRGRRRAKRMLGAKAIGVALPRRIVVASRRMNEAQVGGDSQPEAHPRRPQAPVDVSEMKSVEQGGVERYGLQHFSPRCHDHAVEHGHIADDGAVIENVYLPLRFVGRVMRDPASQMRMPAPAHGRSVSPRAADDT